MMNIDLQIGIRKHVKVRKEPQKIIDPLGKPVLSTQYGLLYQTDCMNLFAALKEETVDSIFADPPFNLGKNYGNGESNDTLATEDYLKWSDSWLDECVRILKRGGTLFVYIIPR